MCSGVCLVVLMGLPGAGKSSFCRFLTDDLISNEDYETYTVEFDNILPQSHYKEIRDQAFVSTEQTIIKSINSAQNKNKKYVVIFIDDNMYYKSMRYQYYKLARKYKISYLQVYIEASLATSTHRNSKRKKEHRIPITVIEDMLRKFEAPGKEHWETNLLVLPSDFVFNTELSKRFLQVLEKSLEEPIHQQTDTAKTGTLPQSKLQNVDLLLRRIVHAKLIEDKTNSVFYVSKRKETYNAIKSGEIILDDKLNPSELYSYLESLF